MILYNFIKFVSCTCLSLFLVSCGVILHGSSTDVTIKSDNGLDNDVDIIAVGPKKVVKYYNMSLPCEIKVQHNNLPLRVSMVSKESVYDPFTIESETKGDFVNTLGQVFGWSSIASSAIIAGSLAGAGAFDGVAAAVTGGFALGGVGLIALGKSAKIDLPRNKFFSISSTHNHINSEQIQRLRDIQDIYLLLQQEEYILAEAKARSLIESEPSGELYYLKGISNYYLDEYKQALNDLKLAQYLVEPSINPGLYKEIDNGIDATNNARYNKKEKRKQMWAEIAGSFVQAGAMTYQAYAQAEYINNMQTMGMSPSGVITDPTKLSQSQLNQLIDPRFAAQQVMNREIMEYQEFCRYNKKPDGSNYTFDEFWALKGESLLKMKEQGIDLVAEQREYNENARKEWRKEMELDRQRRLEEAKAFLNKTAPSTSNKGVISTSSSAISQSPSSTIKVDAMNKPVSQTSTIAPKAPKDNNLDSKQQFKTGMVSSDDYTKIKNVTLYWGDGNRPVVMMKNVELCKKGANTYIKIGNTYYSTNLSSWNKFSHSIVYGAKPLYFNE